MPEGSFLEQKPRSLGSLAIVIAAHAAVISALALSKMAVPPNIKEPPLDLIEIKEDPDPPPVPQPPEPAEIPQAKSVLDRVPPKVPLPPMDNPVISEPAPLEPIIFNPLPPRAVPQLPATQPPTPKPVPPVRGEARIDPRSELQPPYPTSEERLGNEGSVTVRVEIGANGRVTGISKVRATSDAFWRATERHALRHWRFRPATVGGRPVESTKTMTVHFQLRD